MGKDRSGNFHPAKGRPSDTSREELDIRQNFQQNEDLGDTGITESFEDENRIAESNLHFRHPNRNTEKGHDYYREKGNKPGKASREEDAADLTGPVAEEIDYRIDREQFSQLVNHSSSISISIYMSTHASGKEVNERQDTIRFKNMLQQVKKKMEEQAIAENEIQTILTPGYKLLKNDDFWKNMHHGIACYISEGVCRIIKLPFEVKDDIVINSSFYVSPLVPLMTNTRHFYILVISKQQAKFYRADSFGLEELVIPELPKGMDDVVHFEEKGDQKLFRTESNAAGAGASFHGMGAGKPDEKKNIALYLEEVDDTLYKEILNRENVPLLLAGVDYLLPIYRQVSDYNFVEPEGLTGSYEHESTGKLFSDAMEKMRPYFEEPVKKALESYLNQSATPLSSENAAEIIPAAFYSRVAHLFVSPDTHIWGSFDAQNNKIRITGNQVANNDDLLDKAVVQTLMHGGEVHIIDAEQIPGKSNIAALFRYEA